MNISTDTTDGLPAKCHVCGKMVWTTPLTPLDDGTCPHCGTLLWFGEASIDVGVPIQRLAQLGADVEVDAEGEVQLIRFSGASYDDSIIYWWRNSMKTRLLIFAKRQSQSLVKNS